MDFVARGASLIRYVHGLVFLALIVCGIQFFWIMSLQATNAELNAQIRRTVTNRDIYIVPGSSGGVYAPSKGSVLLEEFAKYVAQSLNTYTYESLANQYVEIKKFFTPNMLVSADAHYRKLISTASSDGRSSLFIPAVRIPVRQFMNPKKRDDVLYEAKVVGTVQYILGGSVVEAVPHKVVMTVRQKQITHENPFGFELVSYNEGKADEGDLREVGLR